MIFNLLIYSLEYGSPPGPENTESDPVPATPPATEPQPEYGPLLRQGQDFAVFDKTRFEAPCLEKKPYLPYIMFE